MDSEREWKARKKYRILDSVQNFWIGGTLFRSRNSLGDTFLEP